MGTNKSALLPPDQTQAICEETGRFKRILI